MEFKVEIINVVIDSSKCVLCLELKDELIAITDQQELDIVAVLCRHFWFSSESIRYQSVCRCCWDYVEGFHRFYQQVERLYALDTGIKTQQIARDDSFPELEKEHETPNDEAANVESQSQSDGCAEYVSKESDPLHEDRNDENNLIGANQETGLLEEVDGCDFLISQHTQLQCHNCGLSTSSFLKLMRHISSTHKTVGYVECCGKKFSRRSRLLDHVVKLQSPNAFSCVVCKKAFFGRAGLNEHNMRHSPVENNGLQCDQCNRSFKKISQLNLNCKQHVSEDAREAEELTCSVCQKKFLNKKSLKVHYGRIHGPEEIICEQCPESFKTLAQFRSHKKAKHNSNEDSRKQCMVCRRWLKNASSLRKHMYRHRSSDKQNVCDICGKNAPNALALKSHMLFVHRKERTYQCTICSKAFKRAFSLQEHMTIHTGKTLYNCAYCLKPFNSNANMHAHKKRAHPQEWEQSRREYEKKYECQADSI
uniref:C2H2-type domain-containing protein n=1 Tax=Anopheles atroparvus TaxID=41427 RepID=A0AAG5D6E8_ANOAO